MRDGIGKLSLNDAIFEKCSQLLSEHKRILIFPEGSQADVAYLRPLTKGIARIALRTQQNLKQDIKIMPLGINYFNSFHSGHKLMFNYGNPLSVSSFNKEFELHENKGFQALLKGVSEGIKQQLLIPVETLDYEDKILALNRKNEKESFKSLKSKIAKGNFEKSTSTHKWTKILKYILYIPNLPAVGVLSFILNKLTTDKHFIASMKVAFGALIFPFWLMLSFMLSLIFLNVKFAFVILFIQYLAMYLVPKVSRWSRV